MRLSEREQGWCRVVAARCQVAVATVEQLMEEGLIDRRRAEALAIRERIFDHLRAGARRVEAMQWTAEEFCCSYEKVRGFFYQKQ